LKVLDSQIRFFNDSIYEKKFYLMRHPFTVSLKVEPDLNNFPEELSNQM